MFRTARMDRAAASADTASRSAAGITLPFMEATPCHSGWGGELPRPSLSRREICGALRDQDDGHVRGVMLFSLAYFSAESSISLRMSFGSLAPSQSLVTIWNLLPS